METSTYVRRFQFVTPAEAGVDKCLKELGSGLRRNDNKIVKSVHLFMQEGY